MGSPWIAASCGCPILLIRRPSGSRKELSLHRLIDAWFAAAAQRIEELAHVPVDGLEKAAGIRGQFPAVKRSFGSPCEKQVIPRTGHSHVQQSALFIQFFLRRFRFTHGNVRDDAVFASGNKDHWEFQSLGRMDSHKSHGLNTRIQGFGFLFG